MALTPETTDAILESAWRLISKQRRVDVSLAEIAKAAGVSRQSIYLAFGGRTGLLIAMARRADARSPDSRMMGKIAEGDGADGATLEAFVRAWLSHLPRIYPVGVLLGAAAVTNPDAEEVFRDRMVGGLHAKYEIILGRLEAAGALAPGMDAARAADLCWSLTHIDAWRALVVERGWTREAFVEDRLELIRRAVTRPLRSTS